MGRTRPFAALLAPMLALMLAASCGGSKEKPGGAGSTSSPSPTKARSSGEEAAQAWLEDVCPAISDYFEAISKKPEIADDATLEDGKKALVGFYDNGAQASEKLIAAVDDAGDPDMQNGKEIAGVFKQAFQTAADAFTKARGEAQGLSTTDEQAFASGVVEISRRLEEGLNKVGTVFEDLDTKYPSADLDAVRDEVPACKDLAG